MDEGNRRIVSNDRLELVKAYERETTFRGRALAADALWHSLAPNVRNEICQSQGHHCGTWLQEALAGSDEKHGYPPLSSTARYNLKILLLKEHGPRGQGGRNVGPVWKWLDEGEITAAQVKRLLQRAEESARTLGVSWEASLTQAKDAAKAGRKHSEAPPRPARPQKESPVAAKKSPPSRVAVEKTLQFQSLKKIVEGAPPPQELPIPDGVDPQTYREAYSEMLENVRVVLEIAGRDFSNAKRRFRTTEITLKVGTLAKACRTLRVAVPGPGQLVDEFSSRRRWLEIVRAYHPDKIAGDTSKVQIFDAANKAFETIKEYNRKLAQPKSEETR